MPMNDRASGSAALREMLADVRVLPVLTLHDAGDAVPLARALQAGGLEAIEITLRTDAALAAIESIRTQLPEMLVGAGTVIDEASMAAASRAGAAFAVSPGLTGGLVAASRHHALPLLPGVATASEAMTAHSAGLDLLKLFPASAIGGTRLLRSLAGPLPGISFCPTGGIDRQSFRDYLELPNVLCVGGSWMVPKAALSDKDWPAITKAAQETTK